MSVKTWNPASRVNTSLSGAQQDPDVVALPDGGYVIVWVDDNNDIVGRSFNADGTPRTGEYLLANNVDTVVSPDIAVHADGTIFLTYNTNDTGPDTNFVVAFDTNGAILDSMGISGLATESDDPDIIVNGDDVHLGLGRTISGTEDAYVVSMTWDGANIAIARSALVNNTVTADQEDVDLAALTNGNTVAVWRDGTRVEFEILDSSGVRVIGSDTLVADTGNNFSNPEVMALANGGFVITYARLNGTFPAQGYDTYFKVYGPDGVPYGFEVLINASDTFSDQFYPVATPLNDGGFAVFWFDSDSVNSVRGQLYDGVGNPRGGPFTAAYDIQTRYDTLDADTLADGRIVLTYEVLDAVTGTDIMTTILDPRDGRVEGGHDDDILYGSNFTEEIQGRNGDDMIVAMAGDDLIFGGAGNDTVDGGDGNDTVFGGENDDSLDGGDGNDVFDGGNGDDTVLGGNGADSILGDKGVDLLDGGIGNDTIRGGNGKDTIDGGDGADVLDGNSGLDHVMGGAGADLIRGRAGSDLLEGNDGHDTLEGGSGSDTLTGGVGHDLLDGGIGRDELNGGAGNDTLIGGLRDDTLTGGDGADQFVFATGFGSDVITDFNANNAEDIDLSGVASISGFNDLINNHLVNVGGIAMIDAGGGDTIMLEGVAFASFGVGLAYSADDFIF